MATRLKTGAVLRRVVRSQAHDTKIRKSSRDPEDKSFGLMVVELEATENGATLRLKPKGSKSGCVFRIDELYTQAVVKNVTGRSSLKR